MRCVHTPLHRIVLALAVLAVTVSACGGGGGNNEVVSTDAGNSEVNGEDVQSGGDTTTTSSSGTISENPEIPNELRDITNGTFYVSANTSTALPVDPTVTRPNGIFSGIHERALPLLDSTDDSHIRVLLAYDPAFLSRNLLLVVENFSSETRCNINMQVTQTGIEERTGSTIIDTDDARVYGYYGISEQSRFSGSGSCISAGEKVYATINKNFDIDVFSEVRIDGVTSESGELTTANLTVTDFRIGPFETSSESSTIASSSEVDESLSLTLMNESIEPLPFNTLSLGLVLLDSTGLPVWVETDNLNVGNNFTLQPNESMTVVDDSYFFGSIPFVGDAASVRFITAIPTDNGGPQR